MRGNATAHYAPRFTTDVNALCSKELALYQAVCTVDRLVNAACYALGFGAALEALFVNRAGVFPFQVLPAPMHIDLAQATVQKSLNRLGVALDVKSVRAVFEAIVIPSAPCSSCRARSTPHR